MEKEITLVHLYDASLSRVWKAWTDPEELKQWWGPDNVSIPECEVDLRVGGTFHIVMEAGEAMGPYKGTKWPMLAQFTVVEPESQLSYTAQAWTEGMKEETTIDQTTEITLSESDGKTKVEVKAAILKTGPKAGMAVQGMEMGFTQQLEKLNGFLSA
ncbi:MAG: Activator of Hsp90 ATPase 1 family protein [Parcubacteria group bacterium]|nr:Activator of Hsp90 ATPase 1 family protein [Parcubacteria group bacterium]